MVYGGASNGMEYERTVIVYSYRISLSNCNATVAVVSYRAHAIQSNLLLDRVEYGRVGIAAAGYYRRQNSRQTVEQPC
jgi:hypothetical protein